MRCRQFPVTQPSDHYQSYLSSFSFLPPGDWHFLPITLLLICIETGPVDTSLPQESHTNTSQITITALGRTQKARLVQLTYKDMKSEEKERTIAHMSTSSEFTSWENDRWDPAVRPAWAVSASKCDMWKIFVPSRRYLLPTLTLGHLHERACGSCHISIWPRRPRMPCNVRNTEIETKRIWGVSRENRLPATLGRNRLSKM